MLVAPLLTPVEVENNMTAHPFDIVELLEHILSYLPSIDVLRVQRVSKF